jgi:hypothetical protein
MNPSLRDYCEVCKAETERCRYFPVAGVGNTASVWHVTGRTHGIQVSRAATLNTASNATAITVSRLVDKREQFFGNPLRDVLTLWALYQRDNSSRGLVAGLVAERGPVRSNSGRCRDYWAHL